MSRTPAHAPPIAAAPAPAARAAPSARPTTGAAPVPGTATAAKKPDLLTRRNLIAAGSALAALVLIIALFTWQPWAPKPPRLNADPGLIAKFAATSSMNSLPFSHQREFMEILDEKDEAVVNAYKSGKLSDDEYRRALQLGWYAEQLKKMDNYYQRPPAQRTAYLDKLVDKKKKKKSDGKKETHKSDDKSPLNAEEIDRDDSTEEQDVKRWPSDVREKWLQFRTAYANRKQAIKELKQQQKHRDEGRNSAETATNPAPQGGTQ